MKMQEIDKLRERADQATDNLRALETALGKGELGDDPDTFLSRLTSAKVEKQVSEEKVLEALQVWWLQRCKEPTTLSYALTAYDACKEAGLDPFELKNGRLKELIVFSQQMVTRLDGQKCPRFDWHHVGDRCLVCGQDERGR